MKITIVGGGNIGTLFAVHCAEKGNDVTVYTSQPNEFSNELEIVDEIGNITHKGIIKKATDDPSLAFPETDIIFVTYPSMLMDIAAETIFKYSRKDVMIGIIPGSGGCECAFRKCIERGSVVFGLVRVPAIARLVKKGKSVRSVGYKKELHISSIPIGHVNTCTNIIESIFDIPCRVIPNYLNLTMTPSNPVLHTSRLYTLFGNYHDGKRYQSVPLFYEEWSNYSSEILFLCDKEVQDICKALDEYDLSYVISLPVYYESPTREAMTKKIRSIPAFKGIKTPTKEVGGMYIPDLDSRYFVADFDYGLNCIQQIGRIAGVQTPTIDNIMDWYQSIAHSNKRFSYGNYGIVDKATFDAFYSR